MTTSEIDKLVLARLGAMPMKFSELRDALIRLNNKARTPDMRETDRSLQRLRRAGKIKYRAAGWVRL